MGDSDDSYHFDEAQPMVRMIEKGYDVCMGTRLKGTIKDNAMPTLNRYLGNPALSTIGKVLFRTPLSDFHLLQLLVNWYRTISCSIWLVDPSRRSSR